MRSWTALACILILSASWSAAQESQDLSESSDGFYSVQVGAYPSLAEARSRQQECASVGYDPVWIEETETWNHVLIGRFEFHVDALIYRNDVRERGLEPEAYVRRFREGEAIPLAQHSRNLLPVFAPTTARAAMVSHSAAASDPDHERIVEISELVDLSARRDALTAERAERGADDPVSGLLESELGHLELEAGNREVARSHFEAIANGRVAADPAQLSDARCRLGYFAIADGNRDLGRQLFAALASDETLAGTVAQGEAVLRLGYYAMHDRDHEQARACFTAVANGDFAATETDRIQAMMSAAKLIHVAVDRPGAYRAFRQIQETTSDPAVRAECMVECVGLTMELAESGVGTHDHVRRMAAQALVAVQGDTPDLIQRRATLELMTLETYARQPEPDWVMAAGLAEDFVERYLALGESAPMREVAAAMRQAGMYHRLAGDHAEALRWYGRVLEEIPEDVEHFGGINPRAQAMMGMAHLATLNNDPEGAEQILRDAAELYPDDVTVERSARRRPNLMDRTPSSGLTEQ